MVLLGTPLGNTLGTWREHVGNKGKMKKILPLRPPTQNLKGKKSKHLGCMLQPTHWLYLFLVSKTIGHHFWPRLMAGAEIEQGRKTNNNSRKEKPRPSWVHAEPSHWLHEISISKSVGHHFWPGLMAGSVIWGHSVRIAVWGCRPDLLQTIFLVKPSPMCFPKLLRCHDFSFLFSWQWPCCSECKAILRINLFKIIYHLKAVFGPDTYPRTENIGRRTWADYQQSFTDLAVHSSQISHMADWQPFNASLRTIAIIMARTSNSDQSQLLISHSYWLVTVDEQFRSVPTTNQPPAPNFHLKPGICHLVKNDATTFFIDRLSTTTGLFISY